MIHLPWLPYQATNYIESTLDNSPDSLEIFEWGTGGSTLWFTKNIKTKWLISVEHNLDWSNKVKSELSQVEHCPYIHHFVPPEPSSLGSDPGNPEHYKSASTELGEVNFRRYVSVIDKYGLFDLILIDGMARASCLAHAFNHIKPGGCIVLDNTGDRPYYLAQTSRLFGNWESGWEKLTFMGYGPILAYKWETTIFVNRGKDFYEQ